MIDLEAAGIGIRLKAGAAVAVAGLSLACGQPAAAASYTLIYDFQGFRFDGEEPGHGLVADSLGRLYGTTTYGGLNDCGTAFRLTRPDKSNKWSEELLHSFDCFDGFGPNAPLIIGTSGDLYGTAYGGGQLRNGSVFKLNNIAGWPITVLHSFGSAPSSVKQDGINPLSGLVPGPGGLLYGVTYNGGPTGTGVAFSVSPAGDSVEYALIHKFREVSNGNHPVGLTGSNSGNRLFGVTQEGGEFGQGVAFALKMNDAGAWKENSLSQFAAPGLNQPNSNLVQGIHSLSPDLFGCGPGGSLRQGVVYRLSRPADGTSNWIQTILYNFGSKAGDPSYTVDDPDQEGYGGLTQGTDGRLYGTTMYGGAYNDGAFFELDPPAPGTSAWTEKVLHSFNSVGGAGYRPYGKPLLLQHIFYGIVETTDNFGRVYQLTP